MTSASALEYRSRYELVEEARSLGVERPERMTMQELKDEILRLTLSEEEQQGARGLFGVARAMLAGVVEAGLKMPDAARLIRGDVTLDLPARSRSPVATVTLAEIYAAQGYMARALAVLDEVLASEPGHEEALRIRRELCEGAADEGAAAEARPVAFRAEPFRAEPFRAEPFRAEPFRAEPFRAEPFRAEPSPAQPPGEFPSTEYVPVDVVEATGHESTESVVSDSSDAWPGEPVESQPADPSSEAVPAVEPEGEVAAIDAPIGDVLAAPILAAEQRGSSLCLYWELSPEALSRSGLDPSEGRPALVVVAFTASGPSPLRDQRSIPLTWQAPFAGTFVVSDLGHHAAVRAAVGWILDETFLPLAVGRSLERLGGDSPAAAARAQLALSGLLPRT